jgi:hypothetical protein
MTKSIVALTVLALLVLAASAYADPPTITAPQDGAEVGPSVTVTGTAPGADLINVWTEIYNADTDQRLKSVPGLQHAVGGDAAFNVRIAMPSVYLGDKVKLRYEIHAKSSNGKDLVGETKVVVAENARAQSTDATPGTGEAPVVTAPTADQEVGPSVDVTGRAQPGALVVIWTEVYNAETNENLRMVPGLRHAADADGAFHVRVAVPSVALGEATALRYEVHVKAAVNQQYTAETIIAVHRTGG